MNKLIRLSPTGIEYGDYAWNFASGCGNNISGKCNSGGFNCWAYPITQRFADRYPNGFKPTIHPEALLSPLYLKKPSRILCAFMGDLFWDCPEFDPSYCGEPRGQFGEDEHGLFTLKGRLFDTIEKCPQHTFLFLTKKPENLPQWSPFPENAWVGVTATNAKMAEEVGFWLWGVKAKVKYISFEPLLERISPHFSDYISEDVEGIKWVIIGAQTKPIVYPQDAWIQEIEQACDEVGIPVFEKNNLYPAGFHHLLRQEIPKAGK